MTRPRPATPSIRPAAQHPWARFGHALADLADQGRATPCMSDPWPFVSDDHQQRLEAAQACRYCPALAECASYADTQPEGWHVWAGTDRTPTTRGL